MSQRGVSGRNGEEKRTMPEKTIWSQTGILQAIVPFILEVPYGTKVPGIPPTNQKVLKIPVSTPRHAG